MVQRLEIKCDAYPDSVMNVSMCKSLAIDLHRYRNLVGSQDGCFTDRASCHMGCTLAENVSHCIPTTVAWV